MKKKILSLGLLTIVLFTSSCSMFDNFKNKTGTFSEDLVIKEFTNQDKLVLLAGAESNYIEKANENNVLLYDEENSYKYRYFRNADGARVRLQVFLAKKSSEDDLTSYKTDDVIDYQKEGTDPNFTYKMEHYRSGYVIDSNYNLSKEEYDKQYGIIDEYNSKAQQLYKDNFLAKFAYYQENKQTDPDLVSNYSFSYIMQANNWYITMQIKQDNLIYTYRCSYGEFSYQDISNNTKTDSFLQFYYENVSETNSSGAKILSKSIAYQFDLSAA